MRSIPRLMKAPVKPKIVLPKNQIEWMKLMTASIARASEARSRLLPGLRDALAKGKTEQFLRKLGIVHTNDLERIFPR